MAMGPRGGGGGGSASAAATNGTKKGNAAAAAAAAAAPPTSGRTQPSSREWTRRVQSRAGVSIAGGLTNGEKDGDGNENAMDVDGGAAEEADPETREMERMMGFSSFSSTHNTKVPGNDLNYGVRKEKKTEYRQYMNRVGGFNRPLSPSR
ncbi:hypothetical protein SLS55_001687 [Diplodia seriata]|uniref:U4/U6.U5 small nuclear ribonucleoprotein 27kDa protein domain-containing protein n=1 Tax=Diplodia seriata TaxID=420778 RepID=A0ABR3CSN5_9PEZI